MVDWQTVIIAVLTSAVLSFLVTEYRIRREQSVEESAEMREWYNDCIGYTAEVARVWQRNFDEPDDHRENLSEIKSQMALIEKQISRHASSGEQLGADEDVIDALDTLAAQCSKVGERSLHMDSLDEYTEFREEIMAAVDNVEDAVESQ